MLSWLNRKWFQGCMYAAANPQQRSENWISKIQTTAVRDNLTKNCEENETQVNRIKLISHRGTKHNAQTTHEIKHISVTGNVTSLYFSHGAFRTFVYLSVRVYWQKVDDDCVWTAHFTVCFVFTWNLCAHEFCFSILPLDVFEENDGVWAVSHLQLHNNRFSEGFSSGELTNQPL